MKNFEKTTGRAACALTATLCALAALAGCAGVEHIGWALAATGKPATMVVGKQTLTGEMLLRPDRTGEVRVSSVNTGTAGAAAIASCAGSLRFSGSSQGRIDMRCSDGAMFDMPFYLINEVKGFASGVSQDVPAALVFGMDEVEAQAYLSRALVRPADATKPALQ